MLNWFLTQGPDICKASRERRPHSFCLSRTHKHRYGGMSPRRDLHVTVVQRESLRTDSDGQLAVACRAQWCARLLQPDKQRGAQRRTSGATGQVHSYRAESIVCVRRNLGRSGKTAFLLHSPHILSSLTM